MIGYENSGKTMDKKVWCGDDFSDAAVPEKLFINFFWPKWKVNSGFDGFLTDIITHFIYYIT